MTAPRRLNPDKIFADYHRRQARVVEEASAYLRHRAALTEALARDRDLPRRYPSRGWHTGEEDPDSPDSLEKAIDALMARADRTEAGQSTVDVPPVRNLGEADTSTPTTDRRRVVRLTALTYPDLLRFARDFLTREDRATLDLARADLREDVIEMSKRLSSWRICLVVMWRSLVELAPFFWRAVRKLLPFRWMGWERPSSGD